MQFKGISCVISLKSCVFDTARDQDWPLGRQAEQIFICLRIREFAKYLQIFFDRCLNVDLFTKIWLRNFQSKKTHPTLHCLLLGNLNTILDVSQKKQMSWQRHTKRQHVIKISHENLPIGLSCLSKWNSTSWETRGGSCWCF